MTGATLPFQLDNEDFKAKWQEYLDYRKERRLPKLLPRSVQKQWDHLADYGPEIACAAIDETIRNQWTGIFPQRVHLGNGQPSGRANSRVSLGSLQFQLKKVEEELQDLIYPGGCAHPQKLEGARLTRAADLRTRRDELKHAISKLPL